MASIMDVLSMFLRSMVTMDARPVPLPPPSKTHDLSRAADRGRGHAWTAIVNDMRQAYHTAVDRLQSLAGVVYWSEPETKVVVHLAPIAEAAAVVGGHGEATAGRLEAVAVGEGARIVLGSPWRFTRDLHHRSPGFETQKSDQWCL